MDRNSPYFTATILLLEEANPKETVQPHFGPTFKIASIINSKYLKSA